MSPSFGEVDTTRDGVAVGVGVGDAPKLAETVCVGVTVGEIVCVGVTDGDTVCDTVSDGVIDGVIVSEGVTEDEDP